MQIGVLANDQQWQELMNGANVDHCVRIYSQAENVSEIDGFLVLEDTEFDYRSTSKPVIKNSVSITLSEMNAPPNVVRINGWNSFIKRPTWEVAGQITEEVRQVLFSLGKQEVIVLDQPGFVAARIISMIINEAYFALGDNISTKEEIDIAMRSGTNYPYGPFEWALLIGRDKVFTLLNKLSAAEIRYQPAPLLGKELNL
jgi:3-hydroxybutyryl-CoA dehydrogenase